VEEAGKRSGIRRRKVYAARTPGGIGDGAAVHGAMLSGGANKVLRVCSVRGAVAAATLCWLLQTRLRV